MKLMQGTPQPGAESSMANSPVNLADRWRANGTLGGGILQIDPFG